MAFAPGYSFASVAHPTGGVMVEKAPTFAAPEPGARGHLGTSEVTDDSAIDNHGGGGGPDAAGGDARLGPPRLDYLSQVSRE
jgi:hypothetical protein